jgi:hypothetical protein
MALQFNPNAFANILMPSLDRFGASVADIVQASRAAQLQQQRDARQMQFHADQATADRQFKKEMAEAHNQTQRDVAVENHKRALEVAGVMADARNYGTDRKYNEGSSHNQAYANAKNSDADLKQATADYKRKQTDLLGTDTSSGSVNGTSSGSVNGRPVGGKSPGTPNDKRAEKFATLLGNQQFKLEAAGKPVMGPYQVTSMALQAGVQTPEEGGGGQEMQGVREALRAKGLPESKVDSLSDRLLAQRRAQTMDAIQPEAWHPPLFSSDADIAAAAHAAANPLTPQHILDAQSQGGWQPSWANPGVGRVPAPEMTPADLSPVLPAQQPPAPAGMAPGAVPQIPAQIAQSPALNPAGAAPAARPKTFNAARLQAYADAHGKTPQEAQQFLMSQGWQPEE